MRTPRVLPFPPSGGAKPDLERAAAVLRRGGLMGFPTDTVYGIGTHALKPASIERMKALKGRDPRKPFAILIESARAVSRLTHMDARARALARAFWPGGLTLVLPPRASARALPKGPTGVALRVPGHAGLRKLMRLAGGVPLAASSANRAGEPECKDAAQTVAAFPDLDLVLDGGAVHGRASTVVDLTGPEPQLTREGAVPWGRVLEVLAGVR